MDSKAKHVEMHVIKAEYRSTARSTANKLLSFQLGALKPALTNYSGMSICIWYVYMITAEVRMNTQLD